MTGTEMMTSLGYRLEDTTEANFGQAQKLQALNDAQRQAISMLTNAALVHAQKTQDLGTGVEDANFGGQTYFALPDNSELLMNRIVRVYDNTNERFIEMVSPAGFTDHSSYNYGTMGTLISNRLYVSTNDTQVDSVKLIYIPSLANIADSATEIEHLSDSVQQVILELAEALLWRQDNRQNRASAASANAAAMIQVINAQGV